MRGSRDRAAQVKEVGHQAASAGVWLGWLGGLLSAQDPTSLLKCGSAWKKDPAKGVGGFIYRGWALADLNGKMVFGDFSTVLDRPSGQVFVATPPVSWDALWPIEPLIQVDQRLHTLGEDAEGELYLLTTAQGIPVGQTGKIWKLVRADAR